MIALAVDITATHVRTPKVRQAADGAARATIPVVRETPPELVERMHARRLKDLADTLARQHEVVAGTSALMLARVEGGTSVSR